MNRILGPVLAGVFFLACGVGDDDTTPPPDEPRDERIMCQAKLTMSGTFTAAAALDPAMGCQPIGTWSVNVALADMGDCTGTIPFKPNYSYTVERRTPDPNDPNAAGAIIYNGTGDETALNVSSGGGGQCNGKFTHLNPNGSMFNEFALRPWMEKPTTATTTMTLQGDGTYSLWREHP